MLSCRINQNAIITRDEQQTLVSQFGSANRLRIVGVMKVVVVVVVVIVVVVVVVVVEVVVVVAEAI